MYTWRVTKYNPLFRDENGVFLRDDWTSVADIGKALQSNHGQSVTVEEYLSVEDAYIGAIQAFLEGLDVPALYVSHLEKKKKFRKMQRMKQERKMYPTLYREEMLSCFLALEDGQSILRGDLAPLCRLILREYTHGVNWKQDIPCLFTLVGTTICTLERQHPVNTFLRR